MEKVYVPPLKIQGIKTKLIPYIKQYVDLQKDSFWIEPFLGSGVVGFNINPSNAIFTDSNPHIINFYNSIKNGEITSLKVKLFLESEGQKLSAQDDKYYYEVRDRFNEFHQPLDFLFLNRSCFNGMMRFNKSGDFNVPYGHKPNRFSKAYITKIANQISYVENCIHKNNWLFLCQSFEQTLSKIPTDSFIYCDPPYIGRHVDYYDSWSEDDEKKLHDLLMNSGEKFMLSTWDYNKFRNNPFIELLWSSCNKVNINHFYHIGASENNRNAMVEALLMNYSISRPINCESIIYQSELNFA